MSHECVRVKERKEEKRRWFGWRQQHSSGFGYGMPRTETDDGMAPSASATRPTCKSCTHARYALCAHAQKHTTRRLSNAPVAPGKETERRDSSCR